MNNDESPEAILQWQTRFASQANNRAWALAEQVKRTPEEDEEMLQAAHAAMYLWRSIGTPRNHAHAAQLVAHAYALLRDSVAADRYFAAANTYFGAGLGDPWELALADAVGANVACCAGRATEHLERYTRAEKAIRSLPDEEDRQILNATLRVVPNPKVR